MSSINATARTSSSLLVLSSLAPSSPSSPLPSVTPSAAPSSVSVPQPSSPPPSPSNPPSASDPASSPPPAPSSAPPPPESSAPPPPPPPPPPPSSAPPPAPPTSQPPASNPPAPSPAPPTTQGNADTTRVVTAPSAEPTTEIQTIIVTPSATGDGQSPSVVVITSVITPSAANTQQSNTATNASNANPTNTGAVVQGQPQESSNGLGTGGKTAIAVVIPVVVVALLVLGGIFFWRRRKQRKSNEDERRKEVEEYGYNPNHDPTLPAVGGLAMAEDDSGYRGWGNTATSSNRKASTTLTSGMTYSDSNSNPGGYASPNSPTHGAYSDANSDNPLMHNRRETMDSDGIGALGVVNGAAAANSANNQVGVHRGPSNASSSYSAANRSDNSGEYPGMPMGNPQDYYDQGYYQSNPYAQNDPYTAQQQPIIRDVSARRNTRIENPSVFPQQGNSGIAQNF